MNVRLMVFLVIFLLSIGDRCCAESDRPNIVLFLADDLGWTGLSCFGSDLYETPHLDALAKNGMKFTAGYSSCTVCSPSRASIMTGMYPARLHLTSFIPGQDRPWARMSVPEWTKGLGQDYTTVAEALKTGGYRTWHIGKWHLDFPGKPVGPTAHGFDFTRDRPAGSKGHFLSAKAMKEVAADTNFATDYFGQVAAQKIEQKDSAPFFLYFAFHVPHTPVQGRKDLVKYFEAKVDPAATHKNPVYAAMVKSMDMAVGRVVESLEKTGQIDNTIIIFTSDNGGLTQRYGLHDNFTENLPLRRGKGSAYEGGVRVPTIVSWPGVTEPGSVCDEPVMGIDLYPTLLDITGINVKSEHYGPDGVSFRKLLSNPESTLDRDIFWHFPHYHAGGDSPYSSVRSGDWRLVEFSEDGSLELYHLANDVGESRNLATTSPEIANGLHRKLVKWRQVVGAQLPGVNPGFDSARATEKARKKKKKID